MSRQQVHLATSAGAPTTAHSSYWLHWGREGKGLATLGARRSCCGTPSPRRADECEDSGVAGSSSAQGCRQKKTTKMAAEQRRERPRTSGSPDAASSCASLGARHRDINPSSPRQQRLLPVNEAVLMSGGGRAAVLLQGCGLTKPRPALLLPTPLQAAARATHAQT